MNKKYLVVGSLSLALATSVGGFVHFLGDNETTETSCELDLWGVNNQDSSDITVHLFLQTHPLQEDQPGYESSLSDAYCTSVCQLGVYLTLEGLIDRDLVSAVYFEGIRANKIDLRNMVRPEVYRNFSSDFERVVDMGEGPILRNMTENPKIYNPPFMISRDFIGDQDIFIGGWEKEDYDARKESQEFVKALDDENYELSRKILTERSADAYFNSLETSKRLFNQYPERSTGFAVVAGAMHGIHIMAFVDHQCKTTGTCPKLVIYSCEDLEQLYSSTSEGFF